MAPDVEGKWKWRWDFSPSPPSPRRLLALAPPSDSRSGTPIRWLLAPAPFTTRAWGRHENAALLLRVGAACVVMLARRAHRVAHFSLASIDCRTQLSDPGRHPCGPNRLQSRCARKANLRTPSQRRFGVDNKRRGEEGHGKARGHRSLLCHACHGCLTPGYLPDISACHPASTGVAVERRRSMHADICHRPSGSCFLTSK